MDIMAVGPRELPPSGEIRVWVDGGTTAGHMVPVPVESLRLARIDDGQGQSAIYVLQVRRCMG